METCTSVPLFCGSNWSIARWCHDATWGCGGARQLEDFTGSDMPGWHRRDPVHRELREWVQVTWRIWDSLPLQNKDFGTRNSTWGGKSLLFIQMPILMIRSLSKGLD